jgi:hypothetical protein
MKINDEAYVRVLMAIVVLCLIAITIKYVMSESAKVEARAVSLLPPASQAVPPAPAPRNSIGFTARPFTRA